jgi:phosphoadenosine phosphosulfate reductase
MLIENTLFGVKNKIEIAIERLRAFEPEEGYYLAFSGGKDSQAVYHLAKMAGVKFDAHMNLTSVDPPEVIEFCKKYYPDVELHRPEKTMFQLIVENKIPPTRFMRYCCVALKEGGGAGRHVLTGVRWSESTKRRKRRMTEVCMKDKTKIFLHPIIDWEESDVWEFIKEHLGIPYCSLYDEGFKRIGCIGCPMGQAKQMEAQFVRWPQYRKAYLRAFGIILKNRNTNWKTPEDVMQWWLYGQPKIIEGQFSIFD